MICMIRSPPVSPSAETISQDASTKDSTVHPDEEEIVDFKHAIMSDPIEGVEHQDPDSQHAAVPLPEPPMMTPAERAKHNLTHQPPHRGCPNRFASLSQPQKPTLT